MRQVKVSSVPLAEDTDFENYVLLSARGQICSDLCSKFCKKFYNQLYIALTKIAFISSVHFTDSPADFLALFCPRQCII